jgi:hypothetical protein
MHIEGAKAMTAFLSLNTKGFTMRGPTRNAFICAAATLFCIPAQYMSELTQLGLGIAQNSQLRYYDTSRFSDENRTGTNDVAHYLVPISTTVAAEQWQAWAAAYVEMELEMHPNSSHATQLREVQAQAHECIDQDHTPVLQNVSESSPGYHTPGSHTPRTTHRQYTTHICQSEMDNTEADPPTGTINNDVQI